MIDLKLFSLFLECSEGGGGGGGWGGGSYYANYKA